MHKNEQNFLSIYSWERTTSGEANCVMGPVKDKLTFCIDKFAAFPTTTSIFQQNKTDRNIPDPVIPEIFIAEDTHCLRCSAVSDYTFKSTHIDGDTPIQHWRNPCIELIFGSCLVWHVLSILH